MRDILMFILGVVIGIIAYYLGTRYVMTPKQAVIMPSTSMAPKTNETETFSIEDPPSNSLFGKISSSSGTLLHESRTATESSKLENTETKILQGEMIATDPASHAQLNFDEKLVIDLGENSEINLIQTLPNNFTIQERRGEVKYKINNIPFFLRIRSGVISSSGGELEVSVFDNDSIVIIKPLKGSVKIGFNDLDYVSQTFTLREGEEYEFNTDERTVVNIKNK